MKIVAGFLELPKGSYIPELYARREDGSVDSTTSNTLLDLVSETGESLLPKLDSLLLQAQLGTYKPANPDLADWGFNDKGLWAVPRLAPQGMVAIFNDNIFDFAMDTGNPACFEISIVREVIRLWLLFLESMSGEGMKEMIGKTYEATVGVSEWVESTESADIGKTHPTQED